MVQASLILMGHVAIILPLGPLRYLLTSSFFNPNFSSRLPIVPVDSSAARRPLPGAAKYRATADKSWAIELDESGDDAESPHQPTAHGTVPTVGTKVGETFQARRPKPHAWAS